MFTSIRRNIIINNNFTQPKSLNELKEEFLKRQEENEKVMKKWTIIDLEVENEKKEKIKELKTQSNNDNVVEKKIEEKNVVVNNKEDESIPFLQKFFIKKTDRIFLVKPDIDILTFTKILLLVTKDLNEKRNIVSEKIRLQIQLKKKRKKTIRLLINNNYKYFKFI